MNMLTSIHGKDHKELVSNLMSKVIEDLNLQMMIDNTIGFNKPMVIVSNSSLLSSTNLDEVKIDTLFKGDVRKDLMDLKMSLKGIGITKISDVIDIKVLDYSPDVTLALTYNMLVAMGLEANKPTKSKSFYIDLSNIIDNESITNLLLKISDCYDNLDIVYTRKV